MNKLALFLYLIAVSSYSFSGECAMKIVDSGQDYLTGLHVDSDMYCFNDGVRDKYSYRLVYSDKAKNIFRINPHAQQENEGVYAYLISRDRMLDTDNVRADKYVLLQVENQIDHRWISRHFIKDEYCLNGKIFAETFWMKYFRVFPTIGRLNVEDFCGLLRADFFGVRAEMRVIFEEREVLLEYEQEGDRYFLRDIRLIEN